MNVDAVKERAARASAPSARKEIDSVPHRGDATKDLMEMDFGAAAVGILSVVPVDDENPH
jgi:hypothetical protein